MKTSWSWGLVGLVAVLGWWASPGGTVQDRAKAAPARIVSLSPNVTEILQGLDVFDRVVAVSEYCELPPEAAGLPRVGAWMNANLEQLAALRPDLTIMADAQAPFVEDQLESLGLRTLVVPSQSLADVFDAIERIGRAVDRSTEAEALVRDTRKGLDEVRLRTRGLRRPSVLTVVDRLPGTLRDLYVATEGSYLVELVDIAGGEPIAPPAPMGYARVSTEAVVTFDPEVILDIVQSLSRSLALLRGNGTMAESPVAVWSELKPIRAVRHHRVYTIGDKLLVHPSQLVAEAARRIARILHPEAFED